MKKLLLNTLLTALAVSSAAALTIPKGIFRVAETDTARTEAAEEEVAVAYILFPEKIQPS
jgi:hypothetical protein